MLNRAIYVEKRAVENIFRSFRIHERNQNSKEGGKCRHQGVQMWTKEVRSAREQNRCTLIVREV